MSEKTTHVPLAEATAEQLRSFAELSLQIKVPRMATVETMRAQIAQVHDGDIPVTEDAGEKAPPAAIYKLKDLEGTSRFDPLVNITVEVREGEGGSRPIDVAVGGKAMLIPRGQAVDVPYRYYEALMNAVRTNITQAPVGSDIDLIETHTRTHSFSVNRMPPQNEIDEWLRVQGAAT